MCLLYVSYASQKLFNLWDLPLKFEKQNMTKNSLKNLKHKKPKITSGDNWQPRFYSSMIVYLHTTLLWEMQSHKNKK